MKGHWAVSHQFHLCLSYFPPLVPFSLFLSHSFLLLSLTPPSSSLSSLSSLSSPPLLLSLLPLSSFLSRQIMYQIFSAVEHMHAHHVVHRDLKVMNTSMHCKYIVCKPVYWSMQASLRPILLEYASQFTGVYKPMATNFGILAHSSILVQNRIYHVEVHLSEGALLEGDRCFYPFTFSLRTFYWMGTSTWKFQTLDSLSS